MQEPICPKLVNELLQTLELRHVKRVAQWVDDQGAPGRALHAN